MSKVITYGTFDLLHIGHIRLLERAKQLGDYLIVGVTSDDFDRQRGKINTKQSLMERMAAVSALGIADEVIVEEYIGQKIDDIKRYDVDIFTVGSDWTGQFDYLKEYCTVIYLPRTEGISSTGIRTAVTPLKLGIVGSLGVGKKVETECEYVNGVEAEKNVEDADAVYIVTMPENHYSDIKGYIEKGKHVMCESPIATTKAECEELFSLAKERGCVLMDCIKSAYSTAYSRLLLLVKSGAIGDVISVDATCTSLADLKDSNGDITGRWNSICAWGPTALLPIFQILGTDYTNRRIISRYINKEKRFDGFTKIDFEYPSAVASVKVAKSAKSEGNLIITGSKGYIYVPAPWWKTEYFEIRFEDATLNKRFFYQLDGEGIRYEIVAFNKSIEKKKDYGYIEPEISAAIADIIDACMNGCNVTEI